MAVFFANASDAVSFRVFHSSPAVRLFSFRRLASGTLLAGFGGLLWFLIQGEAPEDSALGEEPSFTEPEAVREITLEEANSGPDENAPRSLHGQAPVEPIPGSDWNHLQHSLPWLARLPSDRPLHPALVDQLEAWIALSGGEDLTDVDAFYTVLADRRAQLGLDPEDGDLRRVASLIRRKESLKAEALQLRADLETVELAGVDDEGRGFALLGFRNGEPLYAFTQNAAAAITTGAHRIRRSPSIDPSIGPQVDGTGLYVNVNDHGEIYFHPEFEDDSGNARIRIHEAASYANSNRDHMTHVAGTIGARGLWSSALGMAPGVKIRSLIQQYAHHIYFYAARRPWEQNRSVVGNTSLGNQASAAVYSSLARMMDISLFDHPYYVHFYSAGNWGPNLETLAPDHQVGKNMVTVGAVDAAIRDGSGVFLSGASIADFSSRGPTVDGRIKPDLVAQGVAVLSTYSASGYAYNWGTSMSSPNVAGSAVLLIDYYQRRFFGQLPRNSTVRAILFNTTDDLGIPGPDYTFGWGLLNVGAAVQHVKDWADQPSSGRTVEAALSPGTTWTASYTSSGGPARLTLVWLDPAGPVQTDPANRQPNLVNNLHLRLIGPGGDIHYPYIHPYTKGTPDLPAFSPELRSEPAGTGVNNRDPVNQINVANLPAGTYTIEVSHAGSLSQNLPQDFSLAVSGLTRSAPLPAPILMTNTEESRDEKQFLFSVEGQNFLPGSRLFLRHALYPEREIPQLEVLPHRLRGRLDASTLEAGYWDVVVRNPNGAEAVRRESFLRRHISRSTVLATHFGDDSVPFSLDSGWAIAPPSGLQGNPSTPVSGSSVLAFNPEGLYPTSLPPRYATSTQFTVEDAANLELSFMRWLGVEQNLYDTAAVEVSLDGGAWTRIFLNPDFDLYDGEWIESNLALPAVSESSQLQFRFVMGPSDWMIQSIGWNVDALSASAIEPGGLPPSFTEDNMEVQGLPGHVLEFPIGIHSESGRPIEVILAAAPDWLTVHHDGEGGFVLTGRPPIRDQGIHTYTIVIRDGHYERAQTIRVEVLSPPETFGEWYQNFSDTHSSLTLALSGWGEILNEDPDGDGQTNLFEYAFEGHPLLPHTALQPLVEKLPPYLPDRIRLTIPKNPAAIDLLYRVGVSSDLVEWTDQAPFINVVEDSEDSLIVEIPLDPESGLPRFVRVEVEWIPAP